MNSRTLPYLNFLRTTYANLAGVAGADPVAAMQVGAAGALIDYMVEQRVAAPALQRECYAAVARLLPTAEAALPAGSGGCLAGLQALCAAADPLAFGRFNQQLGEMQRRLFALGTAQALTLCRAIVQIESDYHRGFEAAVRAQTTAAANRTAATARNAREYDAGALLDFIRRAFPEEPDVTIGQSGFLTGGFSKFTVGVSLRNTRVLPAEIILRADASATFGGASVVEEYRLLEVMHAHGVRVPRPLAVEATGKVFGSPFMLVEKRPGTSIGHMYNLPQPDKAVCRDVAAQLAAIHRIPVAAFGDRIDHARGRSSDKALAWIAEGLAAWTPLNMPSPVFETAFEWLRRNAALNDEAPRALVHGDVHLANMLVHDHRISAVLDWEFAHAGNPAYDLGYFYDQAVALDSWDAFLDAYREAGAPVPDQRQLDYNILFAATRLGVMTCQSVAEFASGAKPGLAGAVVIGNFFYEVTIMRIAKALERVLGGSKP